ncbi:MAG: OB-fold domain-containing protein [Actinomycetota bacterium]|nr:OB-fold domain-containing protein [Actinomycetota bacterium]
MTDKPFRVLPRVDDSNRHFWTGGEQGQLRFLRCLDCGWWIHPPSPVCPSCLSRSIEPDTVSGRGSVHTFTVNHQPWIPGFDPPYVVAIVELVEQEGLRLTTNLVDVAIDDVRFGMAVDVVFEQYDDVWLPFFRPAVAS